MNVHFSDNGNYDRSLCFIIWQYNDLAPEQAGYYYFKKHNKNFTGYLQTFRRL